MKISKAIEILQDIVHQGEGCFDDDDLDAIKLGIEALKFALISRDPYGVPSYSPLPGEDTE